MFPKLYANKTLAVLFSCFFISMVTTHAQTPRKNTIDTVTNLASQKKRLVVLKISPKKYYTMERVPVSLVVHAELKEEEAPENAAAPNLALAPDASATAHPFFSEATE